MRINLKFQFLTLLFCFASLATFANVIPPQEIPADKWEKLGQRKVNYKVDRDEILVTGYEGSFTALRIHVEKGGINLHRIAVHFRNGDVQDINVEVSMPAGTISRVLNLEGKRRIIHKVVFWYDTKNFSEDKAVVELWGRH
ncbi:MAG: DUF2541 family protein [Saprospiraceae bacterium]|nr:DUF2541 family protein [Saprospiraceae bacterium]